MTPKMALRQAKAHRVARGLEAIYNFPACGSFVQPLPSDHGSRRWLVIEPKLISLNWGYRGDVVR